MIRARFSNIKWERVVGLIILIAVSLFLWKYIRFIDSVEAFINTDIHNVCSPILGQLKMDDLKPGKSLVQQELLFEVYNPRVGELGIFSDYHQLQHRMELIEMDIAQDEISIEKYEIDLKKNQRLQKVGAVAKEVVDDIRYNLESLYSRLQNKKRQLEHLQENMQNIEFQLKLYQRDNIFMPNDGVIWNVFHKDGELVKKGDIVVQVIDANRIWVDAFFHRCYSDYLFPGLSVTIIDAADRHRQGKILFIRQGKFLKEDIGLFYDIIVSPQKKGEEALVTVRIEMENDNIFSPEEFYGYGKNVIVRINKVNPLNELKIKLKESFRKLYSFLQKKN